MRCLSVLCAAARRAALGPLALLLLGPLLLAALATSVLPAAPARAQTPPPAPSAQAAIDSTALQHFRLADMYLRAGQFERAIALLEDLRTTDPHTPVFFDKLKEAYESVKRFDDAIALVNERLAQQKTPVLMAEKARLLYHKGDEAAADSAWQDAVDIAPQQAITYKTVYHSLVDARLFTQAIDVMEQGRLALEDPDAFRTEMAYLYSFTGQHERAIEEYLQMLAADESRTDFVKRRLGRFLDDGEALQQSIAATSRAVREEPLSRPYRELMAYLYLEAGEYRKAFDANRAIDRLEDEDGRVLYAFAHQAADAGAYDVALDAYQLILDRHSEAPVAPEVQRGLGDLHMRWAEALENESSGLSKESRAQYEKALDAYETFLKDYPNHPTYPSALRSIGHLQQHVFADYAAAEATLKEVARRYPHTQAADEAQYGLGRIALVRGDLTRARLIFSRLADRLRSGDLAEQARYELALLDFYEGAFDAAVATAEAITANPESDAGNDGIALKVLIQANRGPDSLDAPLRLFAKARLKDAQHQPAAALSVLDSLLGAHGRHSLADEARFLRAHMLQESGEAETAATAYAELVLAHPRSPLADRSLFAAAQLQEKALGDTEAALQTYMRLLKDYPGSLFVDEVRARVRALRDEGT